LADFARKGMDWFLPFNEKTHQKKRAHRHVKKEREGKTAYKKTFFTVKNVSPAGKGGAVLGGKTEEFFFSRKRGFVYSSWNFRAKE